MRQPYPASHSDLIDAEAVDEIAWVQDIIIGVRKIRSGMNIDPRRSLPVLLQGGAELDYARMERNLHYLSSVGRIESITWLDTGSPAPESSTALVGNMKLLIPLAGLIDKDAEAQANHFVAVPAPTSLNQLSFLLACRYLISMRAFDLFITYQSVMPPCPGMDENMRWTSGC